MTLEVEKIVGVVLKLVPGVDYGTLLLEAEILVDQSLNYMNREDFPARLINIVAKELSQNILNGGEDKVSSIKEGDTTIQYKVSDTGETTFYNITSHLQKFRRLKVV